MVNVDFVVCMFFVCGFIIELFVDFEIGVINYGMIDVLL